MPKREFAAPGSSAHRRASCWRHGAYVRVAVRERHQPIRYTGTVTNAFVQSMASTFDDALRLMEAALSDCPDRLWETDLWPDEAPAGPGPYGGLAGSAPWNLAHHALFCLDYDLSGEFEPHEPPPPFDEHVWAWPSRVFTKTELLGYIDYCRGRVRRTLDALTEDAAARPLPGAHRYTARRSERFSAASRCTSLSTPRRSVSSSPPPALSRNRVGNEGDGLRQRTSARACRPRDGQSSARS